MSSVAFLPKKLSSSNEGSRMFKLPSNNIGPLIKFKRKISVTFNPVRISRVHNSLAGWANCNWLSQITFSWFGNPSYFRSKSFNMVLLNLQWFFGNKHGKVCVLDTVSLNQFIEESLNFFPYRVSPRSEDITTWDIVIINEPWFNDNFRIPIWKLFRFFGFNAQQVDLLFFAFFLLLWSCLFWIFNFLKLFEQINFFKRNIVVS